MIERIAFTRLLLAALGALAVVACSDDSIPRDLSGIYVMRRDGADWRRIPLPPGHRHSPSLSPDGDEIVFLYSRQVYGRIFEVWKAGVGGENALQHP